MAHAQKPVLVFRRNGQVHLNRPGGGGGVGSVDCWQSSCAPSAVVMLDTPCSEVVWRVQATHSTRIFPLHFPYRASPCAITFQLESNAGYTMFRGRVKSTGYPLHSPVSPSLPPVRHRVPSHFNWSLMVATPCSEVVRRVLATHSIRQFPLHFPPRTSPCAITFQLESNGGYTMFRGSAKSTGYPLHSPVSPSLPPRTSPCAITFQLKSNGGYTMFRGSAKSTGYPLHSPVSPSLPPIRHRVPSHFNWSLMVDTPCSEVVRRVLATHSIRQFPLHFPPYVTVCHHISTGV